jgi:hypothetical protein
MKLSTVLAVSSFVLLPLLARADSFTYNLNDVFAGFSATGTITTDTNSGTLGTFDITAFNLVLSGGGQTLSLTSLNGLQEEVVSGGVTATASGLFFDFSNFVGGQLIFQTPQVGSGTDYLCFQGPAGGCNDYNGAHEGIQIGTGAVINQPLTGNLEFASLPSSVTPEPESLLLMGTGLLGVVGALRRRVISSPNDVCE